MDTLVDKTENPDLTIEEYIELEAERARRHGRAFNWETATYGKGDGIDANVDTESDEFHKDFETNHEIYHESFNMEENFIIIKVLIQMRLGELAHTKLTVELADRTVKHPKGIAKNVLVGIAKIDVFKRKITLRVRDEKIIFKSVKPTSSLITRVYMLSLRERMELDLKARLIGEALILNRSLDPLYRDYIELNDLNEPLELRRNQVNDLEPTIEEGEVINEPLMDRFETRYDNEIVDGLDEYPSYCDFDKKIHINCTFNLMFSCMIAYEYVDAKFFPLLSINVMSKRFDNSIMKDKDEGIGNIIVRRPFYKEACIKANWFDGMITICKGNDNVTY
ncbi:hypothetical protein Tco_0343716 [Tanacetum coccineum]